MMEVHFVHKAANDGGLAVVGVFIAEGDESAVLAAIWDGMPAQEGEASTEAFIDPTGLLPQSFASYRYAGSLTTPPCSEVVTWTVLKDPVAASRDQIEAFAKVFPGNFRPIQRLNRRYLLYSG